MIKKIFIILFCLIPSLAFAGPKLFFSDITDGNISGFELSSTKGTAVSLWCLDLPNSRGTSYVTCGGQNLTSSNDYAEWAATTNPTTARGLQRITFFLNSNMTPGSTTISVTVNGETSGSIPFYNRTSGNSYYVSPTGNDLADGLTTATSWLTPQKAKESVAAGDVVYFRGGQYDPTTYDTSFDGSTNNDWVVLSFNNNHAFASLNNSITFTAYPGELPIFGDGNPTVPRFIRQVGYDPNPDSLDYWTFSKLKLQFYDTCQIMGTNSDSTSNYLRWVGVDATTTSADIGRGIAFWFTGNQGQTGVKFYGNYVHHVGKPLNWVESDGSGYRTGPIYFQGFGPHGHIDIGWNEFAYNNGQSQFYGHYSIDYITELLYHDNYVHHTASAPQNNSGPTAVFGGGDANSPHPIVDYEFLQTAYIYNNIFAFNGNDIRFSDASSRGSHGGNIYFWNNTNYKNGNTREFNVGNFDLLDFRNNIVYSTPGGGNYFWYTPETWEDKSDGFANIYYGLPLITIIYSWDDPVTSTANVEPLMTDPDNNNFTPTINSTLVDTGDLAPKTWGVTVDYFGVERVSPDKGAIENNITRLPVLYYSDITSGPNVGGKDNNGVFVTINGNDFGDYQGTSLVTVGGGSVASYPVWSNTKIIFQLGSNSVSGDIVVTVNNKVSNSLPFTVRSGNIYFCTPTGTGDGSYSNPFGPEDFCNLIYNGENGATCYFRAGTYDGEYAHTGWRSNFNLMEAHSGVEGQENAFVSYPGETAILSRVEADTLTGYNFRRYDNATDHGASYIIISGFTMTSDGACVYPGQNTRIINNIMTGCTDPSPAGIIGLDGLADGTWVVSNVDIYGNTLGGGNSGTTQDHAIYPGYGVDNIDIGWNVISSEDNLGSKISINNNDAWGNTMTFENIRIHHNFINTSSSLIDGRAINIFEAYVGSTVYIYDNIIIATTSGTVSPLSFCSGGILLYNNTIYGQSAGTYGIISLYEMTLYGHTYNVESIDMRNNIVYAYGATSFYIEIEGSGMPVPTIDHNLWYGIGEFSSSTLCSNGCAETNGLNVDPLFTINPPTSPNDTILQISSPANGAGTELSVVSSIFTTDYFGVLLSNQVDIGAIQIGVTSIPTILFTTQSGQTVTDSSFTVTGTTSPSGGRTITNVTVGGVSATTSDNFATWSASIPLIVGAQTITAIVTDSEGETGTDSITVTRTSTSNLVRLINSVINGSIIQ